MNDTIRAEALFASAMQPSDQPSGSEVREAVAATLERLGVDECAARLAGAYGDRPETAAVRMAWALRQVTAAFSELAHVG